MTLTERVYTHARIMAHDLPEENQALLEAVCRAATADLKNRLRSGVEPEDCLEDFVTAAGMYAMAAMSDVTDLGQLEQVTAGDLTLRRKETDAAATCLRTQAAMLMAPYLEADFLFRGV